MKVGEAGGVAPTSQALAASGTSRKDSAPVTQMNTERVTAIVESFDGANIVGWAAVSADAPPVSVELCLNDHVVVSGWAVGKAKRQTDGEVRGFNLVLNDIWQFVTTTDRITVRLDGRVAPINGEGTYIAPRRAGSKSSDDLLAMLQDGYVFSPSGQLQKSKAIDKEWQRSILSLYAQLRNIVAETVGQGLFLVYGTLLGAVRENGFIGHDRNFDCAYISAHHDGVQAARELQYLAFSLIDQGFRVRCSNAALQVWDSHSDGTRIDIFHLYFDSTDELRFPYGVASRSKFARYQWHGTRQAELSGSTVLVPEDAKVLVEHIYGPDWTSPDLGFDWTRERVQDAPEGWLPAALVEEVYWADFYANTSYTSGSTFCEFVSEQNHLPGIIFDIGCGDGRDSFAFASMERYVVGLDRSHVAVKHAAKKANAEGLDGQLFFVACDVGIEQTLRATLRDSRNRGPSGRALYYARFFLHSIPEDVERTLLRVIAEESRPGDWFAAEFRTDRDEASTKVHGNHYRRFQNGRDFGLRLAHYFGFSQTLIEQEGNGLSPYRGEDPYLYRIVAARPESGN